MNHPTRTESARWTRRTIDTSVGPLAVWETGVGPAVVFRHGIFFDHSLWSGQVNDIAQSHRVVIIDGPGHGASGDSGRRYSLADDANATLQILSSLEVDRATLIGHSWGGMSHVRTAIAAPDRVAALVLVDTPLEPSSRLGKLRYRALRALVQLFGAPPWYGAQVANAMFSETSQRANPALVTDLQEMLVRSARAPLMRAMDAVLVRPDTVLERMSGLAMPILILAGDEDYVLPPSTLDALAQVAPHAIVEVIPGKHVLPLEQPAEVTRRIEEFLRTIPV